MSDHRTHQKQLCEPCQRHYADLRQHQKGKKHARRTAQQVMSWAKKEALPAQ